MIIFCAKIARKFNKKIIIHYRCNLEDQIKNSHLGMKYIIKIANVANVNIVLNNYSLSFFETKNKTKYNNCSKHS